jgi:hypothetical protein
MRFISRWLPCLVLVGLCMPLATQAQTLPAPDSAQFCVMVQKILAGTELEGTSTLFTDMPAYRASKPSPDPLMIYQVVTYAGQRPIMVSCKVKTAAHLRATYGETAAGEQLFCPEVTRLVQIQAVAELQAYDPAAAAKAAAFVVDENEPFITGQSYLSEFELSYVADDGAVHFNSPGLFQNYDHWITWFLPDRFQGQSYCHIASVDYMKALATGEMQPGTIITTVDDAPVTPGG